MLNRKQKELARKYAFGLIPIFYLIDECETLAIEKEALKYAEKYAEDYNEYFEMSQFLQKETRFELKKQIDDFEMENERLYMLVEMSDADQWKEEPDFKEHSYKKGEHSYFIEIEWANKILEHWAKIGEYAEKIVNEKSVWIPNGEEKDFIKLCEEMNIPVNGGALTIKGSNITGKYYYVN